MSGHIWVGPRTARVIVRVSAAEKAEIEAAADRNGGMSVARYLLNLHHVSMGRLEAKDVFLADRMAERAQP